MPTTPTPPANPISEPTRPLSSRPPGLSPMERHLLDRVAQIERESRDRDARRTAEIAQLTAMVEQITKETGPLRTEVAQLRMQLANSDGTISRLTMWLGALLGPEASSDS